MNGNKEIIIYGFYILKRSHFEGVTFHLNLIFFLGLILKCGSLPLPAG